MTQAYAHVLTSAIHTFQTYIYIYINAYVYTYIFILAYSMFIRTCCIVQTLSFHPPPKRRPFDWFYSRTALPPTFCDTPKKFSFFVFLLSLFFSRRIEAAEVAGHEIPFFSAEYSCTIPLSSLGQT